MSKEQEEFIKSGSVVECLECKALLYKSSANKVEVDGCYHEYFCQTHKKPYTSVIYKSFCGSNEDPKKRYARLEVEEDGTPVGYTKKNRKKIN